MRIDQASPALIKFSDWTCSQRELWPLQNLEANGAALNTGQFTELFGAVDQPAFIEASRRVLDECDALRARILEDDDGPRLCIAPLLNWSPAMLDLSGEADPRARAITWMADELGRAFDPQAALFSWTLIKLSSDHFIWCFIVHQLALDGSGRNIVARRLAEVYSRIVGAEQSETPAPGPLSDLLGEDAAYRQSPEFAADGDYWARLTSDPPPAARLTRKSAQGSYLGARHTAPLPASTAAAIRDMMTKTGISLSGLFACLSATYLHRITGASDVVVGLLVAARTTPILRGIPGNVSNTVPLRIRFKPEITIDTLFVQIRARIREALKHQRFALSDMKAAMPELSGELFSIAVNVMKFDYALGFGSIPTASHNLSNGPVDDLSISVFEQPGEDGLQIALNGNVGRYAADELKAHYDRLVYFLDQLCHCDPATEIRAIAYFGDNERERVLSQYGAARNSISGDSFEARVRRGADTPTRLFVLDDRLEPLPIGCEGALYLAAPAGAASAGVDSVACPFAGPDWRMHRTGDIALWREDGELEFVDRADSGSPVDSVMDKAPIRVAQFVGPRNPREEIVCRLFREALGAAEISVNDNFFEAGGHSLLAARLVSRLSAEMKSKVALRAIFEHPTPEALARFLDAREPAAQTPSNKPLLVLFPGGGVVSREVINLQVALAANHGVLLIDYPDWRDQCDVFFDIEKYLDAVLAQIRKAAPTPRPLRLVGYSFGGGVSYVLAIMLRRLGYQLEFLGIIDGRSPVLRDMPQSTETQSLPVRIFEFLRRDGLSRSRQMGRYVGIRAKKPLIRKLLKWFGPYLPKDQSGEFLFYMTSFINAAIPMRSIRDWTAGLDVAERDPGGPTLLIRSRDNGDEWPVDLGWRDLIPAIEIKPVPGTHFTVIGDENLPAICALIGAPPAKSDQLAPEMVARRPDVAA